MKKILILSIILILIIIGFSSVFAMTKDISLPELQAFVIDVKGDANIKKNNSQEWIELKKEQELFSGDEIKTGQDGEVAINFYDNSISQIGPNSQVTFDELFIDDDNYAKTKVSLKVTIGRVWSRIIKLSDKEAVFEVGSDKTVATVRGTAFDFEVTELGVANINAVEDIVEVSTIEVKEEIDKITGEKIKKREIIAKIDLLEGLSTVIDQTRKNEELKKIKTEIISEVEKQSEWFKNNIKNEEKFIEEIERKQAEMIEEIAGTLPDSKLYNLKKATENIRLAMTVDQEKKEELEIRFAARRLAEAQELIEMGKDELAQESINEFQNKAERLFKEQEELERSEMEIKKIEEMRNKINNQINLQENLVNKINPGEEMYDFKRDFEEIKIDIANEEDKDFLMFKQAQERLKEADLIKKEGQEELYNKLMEENEIQTEKIRELNLDEELMKRIDLEKQIIEKREFIPQELEKQEYIPEIKEPIYPEPEYKPEIDEPIYPEPEYKPEIDEPTIDEKDEKLDQAGIIIEHFEGLINEKEIIPPEIEIKEYIPEVNNEREIIPPEIEIEKYVPEVRDVPVSTFLQ